MAGYLPASEGELARSQPPTNRIGAFPASALLGQEKVLYEARPRLLGLHPILVIVPAAFLALFGLVGIAGAATYGGDASFLGGLGFVLFLISIPLLYALSSWRRTSYALTDQRVVAQRGESFESATYDDVRSVSMKPGTSRVIFDLTPAGPGAPTSLFGGRSRRIVWQAVPGAPAVASFAQSAALFYRLRNRQRQLRQDLMVSSMADRIVCAYCGGMIDIAMLDGQNPKCPRCSAPITVAPLGV